MEGEAGRTRGPFGKGWSVELAYLPVMNGRPSFWLWANARIGAQYTIYDKFDGGRFNFDGQSGRNASDNNGLLLYIWAAF